MSGLFYNLGKRVGPKIRTAKWAYLSATAPMTEVSEAEYAVGSDMIQQIHKQTTICPNITQRLKEIANPLIKSLKNNLRTFSFEAIRTPEPQAFCLPGGFVFVSDTMVEYCDSNTDQLAFIMAHEMAHVIQGHVMERMLTHTLIKTIISGGHLRAAVTGSLSQLGTQFLERAYSQENEFRADTFAVRLAAATGYDPAEAIDLFLHLAPLQTGQLLGQYFSTHPPFKSRIQNIQVVIKEITR
jgi:predicted Zn-dependent protease